jgi:phage tail-like protein
VNRLPQLAYHFASESQWRAGVRDDLRVDGGSVRAPSSLRARSVPYSESADGGALITVDPCSRLQWVRPGDRSVRRWDDLGVVELGTLVRGSPPLAVATSGGQLWLATQIELERYDSHDLQQLGVIAAVETDDDARVVAITADGKGGVWVLSAQPSGCHTLVHFDCWGRALGESVAVPLAGDSSGRVASTTRGAIVVVPSRSSRLAVVLRAQPTAEIGLLPLTDGPDIRAIAADRDDRLIVLRADNAGSSAVLELVTLAGVVDERHNLALPSGFGPATGVATARQMFIAGAGGLLALDPTSTATARRVSTFVTPTLRSIRQNRPHGRRGQTIGGWNRAEIDITLPRGTSVELAWTATDDEAIVQRVDAILADESLAGSAKLAALDAHLTWRPEDRVVYESATDSAAGAVAAGERLAAPLDRIEEHLWVKITVTTAVDAEPASIGGLHVTYPAMSLLDALPAVYREDAISASQVRKLLAPFEVLFDGLNARIDRLPERIDPSTADDEWTAVLVGWLGLPELEDLAPDRRRTLLRELPRLHEARGTQWALASALEIVTGRPVRVRDYSGEPAWWFLPRAARARGARLGIDTVIAESRPAPFRAGTAMVGATPLGVSCTDPAAVLAARAGLVDVRIELSTKDRDAVRPVVDRILSVFAPAHCRVIVDARLGSGSARSRRIGVDLRVAETETDGPDAGLHGDEHWQLGATTELASWCLPNPTAGHAPFDGVGPGPDATRLL